MVIKALEEAASRIRMSDLDIKVLRLKPTDVLVLKYDEMEGHMAEVACLRAELKDKVNAHNVVAMSKGIELEAITYEED